MKKEMTNKYKEGEILQIVDNDFNNMPIGTHVKVVNRDLHSYHVKTLEQYNAQWWWVYEKQLSPLESEVQNAL